MTRAQLRRAAREARKLAMEIVAGTAPAFGLGMLAQDDDSRAPNCALGYLGHRWAGDASAAGGLRGPDTDTTDAWDLVGECNDVLPDGLPWALLALADALEDAARSRA